MNNKLKNAQRKLDTVKVIPTGLDDSESPEIAEPVLSSGELGQVQELLFGTQMRTSSEQLRKLQAHYDYRIVKLMEGFDAQLQKVEAKTVEFRAELSAEMNLQRSLQDDKNKQLSDALKLAESVLKAQIDQSASESGNSHARLTNHIEENTRQLSETVDSVRDEMVGRLNAAVASLQQQKLDRQALAGILGSVAAQFSDAPQPLNSSTSD